MNKSIAAASATLVSLLGCSAVPAGDGGRTAAGVLGAPQPEEFPAWAMIPKRETGAARFLEEHPEYDGRGVVVAIFDTGVDPGAPGLQETTDGKPKIIDVVDGSGSGDTDTSSVVEATDGKITGLTGRVLDVSGLTNRAGEWHIGMKPAFEIFPSELVHRLVRERRDDWDELQRAAVADAERALADWDEANPEPKREQLKERADLKSRLEQLKAMGGESEDPGPVYDCVVFHDGQRWRAVIDTDEDGDLSDERAMTDYRVFREWSTFSDEDLMNFAVNIYNDGDVLSIVVDVGAHGTHVAGIVAANFPDRPEYNGVAPGAQIVSVKIGDTRLDSTSVGTGEVRGLITVLADKCDLINESYGGPTPDPNEGRVIALMSEMVNEHGVIHVLSAGNEGPALTTVGGPGATTEALIGVGAVVTEGMMSAQYSIREPYDELHYTWSSRGPTTDGDLGVVVSAPGGAIAPVPNWSLQGEMLMNGTSMASPNTCGSIALLLSGLKAEGMAYTPHTVRRALVNTARPLAQEDEFAVGAGMIQVDKAWGYLVQFADAPDGDVRYEVAITDHEGDRGVYLREPFENDKPLMVRVEVRPELPEDAENRAKVAFRMPMRLEASVEWIDAPEHMLVPYGGANFRIRVDPRGLEPGTHLGFVRGYEAERPERGVLFDVPVTVVRTERADETARAWRDHLSLRPGQIERRFVEVPTGATWADLIIRRTSTDTPRLLLVHMVELLEGRSYDASEFKEYIWLRDEGEVVRSMPVVGGRTLEVCLGAYWSIIGDGEYDVELAFHGLEPSPEPIVLDGGELVRQVDVTAPIRAETIAPRGSLTTVRSVLRPVKVDLRPLTAPRDLLPKNRLVHELVLWYEFSLDADATIRPRPVPTETPEGWEEWESNIWQVFDANKRRALVAAGSDEEYSLPEGEYTMTLHLRHDDPEMLERMRTTAVLLDRTLEAPIAIRAYTDPDDAVADGQTYGSRELDRGESVVVNLRVPGADAIPDSAGPGDVLIGSMSFGEKGVTGAGSRPGGWPVLMTVPPAPNDTEEEPKAPDAEEEKAPAEALAERVRDVKIEHLPDLEDDAAFDVLADEILSEWPGHLPVLLAKLERVDAESGDIDAVLAAADAVLAQIDRPALSAYFGVAHEADDPGAEKLAEQMQEQKSALVTALAARARALYRRAVESEDAVVGFDEAMAELKKWGDSDDEKVADLLVDSEVLHGRLGEALALLNDRAAEPDAPKKIFERRVEVLEQLGWMHLAGLHRRELLVRFPGAYPPF